MSRRARLDAELVRRGLARSRGHAAELIAAGGVRVNGQTATKSASMVDAGAAVVLSEPETGPSYVSRGAHKLLGALAVFEPEGLSVAGRRCLDAGASTGGFTQVLLKRGAKEVVAVDVGYGQLAWELRTDERVQTIDRTNVRTLDPERIGGRVSLTVADLSFISLRLVLPALLACTDSGGDVVPMVKPQFEVGRDRLGAGGVVRDPALWASAIRDVAAAAEHHGWGVAGVAPSPLPGPAGNREFFLWLREGPSSIGPAAITDVTARAAESPATTVPSETTAPSETTEPAGHTDASGGAA